MAEFLNSFTVKLVSYATICIEGKGIYFLKERGGRDKKNPTSLP
jgi:hypothetical protein